MQLLKEEVTVDHDHGTSFRYLWKQPTIKSAFLSKKYLSFSLYESGPSHTFQYVFLNPFQANFFFLYLFKGTSQ